MLFDVALVRPYLSSKSTGIDLFLLSRLLRKYFANKLDPSSSLPYAECSSSALSWSPSTFELQSIFVESGQMRNTLRHQSMGAYFCFGALPLASKYLRVCLVVVYIIATPLHGSTISTARSKRQSHTSASSSNSQILFSNYRCWMYQVTSWSVFVATGLKPCYMKLGCSWPLSLLHSLLHHVATEGILTR